MINIYWLDVYLDGILHILQTILACPIYPYLFAYLMIELSDISKVRTKENIDYCSIKLKLDFASHVAYENYKRRVFTKLVWKRWLENLQIMMYEKTSIITNIV